MIWPGLAHPARDAGVQPARRRAARRVRPAQDVVSGASRSANNRPSASHGRKITIDSIESMDRAGPAGGSPSRRKESMRNRLILAAAHGRRRGVAARLVRIRRLEPARTAKGGTLRVQPHAQRLRVHRPAEVLRHRVLGDALADQLQPHAVPREERRRGQAHLPGGRCRASGVSKDGKTYTFTVRKGQSRRRTARP